MTGEEEINVEYDTTGVSVPEESNEGLSTELSAYLYPKIFTIDNLNNEGGVEFTTEDIENYSVSMNNEKIDISSTKKLINYLKAFVRKSISTVNERIGELEQTINDFNDYLVDSELDEESEHPVANSVLYTEFSNVSESLSAKANVIHNHDINEVNSLETTLGGLRDDVDTKAKSSDLTNHINNMNNPHNITLEQLGMTGYEWQEIRIDINGCKLYVIPIFKLAMFKGSKTVKFSTMRKVTVGWLPKEYAPKGVVRTIAHNSIDAPLIVLMVHPLYTGQTSSEVELKTTNHNQTTDRTPNWEVMWYYG